ncbi:putative Ribosomal protein S18-containing protein [Homarus americanus]|uniref:Putative Ribosomal protein S18-containing protein n=1 Tax=Homarus americanus TaxID=6706 RepID=A0A8J5K010_HOMAM|nr:putative Ribosomal protein S18-containing protein [Homarus americanus]
MFLRPLLTPGLRASWPDIVRKPTLLQMSGVAQARCGIVTSARLLCEVTDGEEAKKQVDPAKDRSKVVPVEVSVKYMKTQAYQTTYGSDPVWKRKTHLCRNRHRELQVAVEKARDYGLLTYDVPFHEYDYSEYFSPVENKEKSTT